MTIRGAAAAAALAPTSRAITATLVTSLLTQPLLRVDTTARSRQNRGMNAPNHGGYVVLRHADGDEWRMIGEVDRRPGLPARKSRAQAVRDVMGRDVKDGEVFAVVPKGEWRNGL